MPGHPVHHIFKAVMTKMAPLRSRAVNHQLAPLSFFMFFTSTLNGRVLSTRLQADSTLNFPTLMEKRTGAIAPVLLPGFIPR